MREKWNKVHYKRRRGGKEKLPCSTPHNNHNNNHTFISIPDGNTVPIYHYLLLTLSISDISLLRGLLAAAAVFLPPFCLLRCFFDLACTYTVPWQNFSSILMNRFAISITSRRYDLRHMFPVSLRLHFSLFFRTKTQS